MKQASAKYALTVRERAVRMVSEHASRWAAISSIPAMIGCNPETLQGCLRLDECNQGKATWPSDG